MWVKEQKKSAGPEPYAKTDATVITPDRQVAVVSMETSQGPKPKDTFSKEVLEILGPWEKSALLRQRDQQAAGIVPDLLQTKIRDKGDQNWAHFEFGFNPDEIAGKETEIFEAVKKWASESHVGGKMGPRAAVVYDWHTDGNKPHIRVAINGLPWDETEGGTPSRTKHGNLDVVKGKTHTGMLSKGSELGEEMLALAEAMSQFEVGVFAYGRNYSQNFGLSANPGVSASVSPIQTTLPSPNQAPKTAVGTVPRAGLAPTSSGLDALEGAQLAALARMEAEVERTRQALEQTQMAKQALLDKAQAEAELQDARGELTQVRGQNEELTSQLDQVTQDRDRALVVGSELSETLAAVRQEMEHTTEELTQTREALDKTTADLSTQTQRAERAEQTLESTTAELDQTRSQRDRAVAEAAEATNRATTAEGLVEAQAQTIRTQKETIESTNQALERERERSAQLDGNLEKARGKIDEQRQTIDQQAEDLGREKRARVEAETEVSRLTPLVSENATLRERVDAVENENNALKQRIEKALNERRELEERLRQEGERIDNLTGELDASKRASGINKRMMTALFKEGSEIDSSTQKSMMYRLVQELDEEIKENGANPNSAQTRSSLINNIESLEKSNVLTRREEREMIDALKDGKVLLRFPDVMVPRRAATQQEAAQLAKSEGAIIVPVPQKIKDALSVRPATNRPRGPGGQESPDMS